MNKTNICTIEEWSVNWNELNNILICSHEFMHETLIVTTIYGTIQRLIKLYSDRFPNDLLLKRVQYELFRNVLFLQESCATFCSVMQVSDSVKSCEDYLPSSYWEFYNTFYNCFKSTINSTYLAYNLAEVISQLCMNNLICHDIISFFKNEKTTFSNSQTSPTYCFKKLLKNLHPATLHNLINYCNLQINDTLCDVNSDNYWKQQDCQQLRYLNDIVFKSSYSYLSKEFTEIKFCTIEELNINTDSCILSVSNFLESMYGNIEVVLNSHPMYTYNLTADLIIALECLDNTKIYNKPPFRSAKALPSTDLIGLNYKKEKKKLHLHTYLNENCFFNEQGNWYAFNSNGFTHDSSYFHFNNLHTQLSANPLFVIGITSTGQTNITLTNEINVLPKKLRILCKQGNIKNLSRYSIMFYMFGKFSLWLDYLVQYKQIKFCILSIEDHNSPIISSNNFSMIAIYSSSLPGIFIRCFNALNYSKALQIINALSEQKLITPDYSNEHTIVGTKMKQAFDAIDSLWLEY